MWKTGTFWEVVLRELGCSHQRLGYAAAGSRGPGRREDCRGLAHCRTHHGVTEISEMGLFAYVDYHVT
jgi:hypothetical protein